MSLLGSVFLDKWTQLLERRGQLSARLGMLTAVVVVYGIVAVLGRLVDVGPAWVELVTQLVFIRVRHVIAPSDRQRGLSSTVKKALVDEFRRHR